MEEDWTDDHEHSYKRKFTHEEDEKIIALVKKHGLNGWKTLASCMPGRTARQCRERWKYYLDPATTSNDWTVEEDNLLLSKYRDMGTKWSLMSKYFVNKNGINLKNRFHKLQRKAHKNKGGASPKSRTSSDNSNSMIEESGSLRIIEFPSPISMLPVSQCMLDEP